MKRWLIPILVLAMGLPGAWLRAAPAAGPNRFLLLVEASATMSSRSELTALAVADLIERGLGGRMRAGDIFSIVPFNEQLDPAGYARKEWDPNKSRHISNLAFLYLQKYKFEKRVRNDRVMALIQLVAQNERNIVIYLVTSGEDPVSDTPFDAEVNAVYREHLPKWQAAKAIGITALVAENGKLADWAVGVAEPPAPIKLLARKVVVAQPKPPVTNQVDIVAANTNPPTVIKPATNQMASAGNNTTPTNKPPPVKATNQTTVATVTPPKTDPPPVIKPQPTNTVAVVKPPEITPDPPKPPATNPVVNVVAPPPAATNRVVVALPPIPTASNAVAPTPPSAATATNATAPKTDQPTAQPLAAVGPANSGRPFGLLLAGVGLLLGAIWLSVVWYRRTRPAAGPSLITQSMDRTRHKPPK